MDVPFTLPTETQEPGDVHETALSVPGSTTTALGGCCIDQMAWLRLSVRGNAAPAVLVKLPTAVQSSGDAHEMPSRMALCAPGGCEIGWIAHRDPFHRSATSPAVLAFVVKPAATVQALADVQDKPSICTALASRGFGIRRLIHTRPVHRAANGTDRLPRRANVPIAVQRETFAHATSSTLTLPAPEGRGADATAHL